MDAVMFRVKAAHLASQRFGRRLLRGFGLTPARFDLMNALGRDGMRQSELWKQLNVVRSVISEMLGALLELGWVKRSRAPDGRTWRVQLTKAGRDVFERAYDRWVESGDVALAMDAALCGRHVELDADRKRLELIDACDTLDAEFRGIPWGHGGHVYPCDPEDYYQYLTYPGEPECGIPWVA